MSVLQMADGQSHNCPIDYATLRGLVFEAKNTAIDGVVMGPGNPPMWIEVPVDGGRLTITRVNVVALRP